MAKMQLDRLGEHLSGHKRIGLDSNILIYHLEAHPVYLPLTRQILSGIERGQWEGVISTVSLMEVTVQPWRLQQPRLALEYEALLANFPNLTIVDVDRTVARQAARLRGELGCQPPDAILVASTIVAGATLFVTNDARLARQVAPALATLCIDDFVG